MTSAKPHYRLFLKIVDPNKQSSKLSINEVSIIKNKIEKSFSNENIDFEITSMQPTNNGNLMIKLPTKKDQQTALGKLQEKSAHFEIITTEPKKINPRLIIPNIPAEINSDEFISEIKTQNPRVIDEDENDSDQIRVVAIHDSLNRKRSRNVS